MNGNGVVRHYDRLEADERFRLELRAAARDDHEELRQLLRTCPRKSYRMNDAAFAERAECARLLALIVVGEIRPHFARAGVLRASAEATKRALVLGVESALAALEAVPSEEELAEAHRAVDDSSLAKMFEDVLASDLAQAAAVWQAFDAVCREDMAVDPVTVIAAAFGREFATLHAEEFDQVAAASADDQALADWRDLFARRWRLATA